jgi:hypothetical protein
VYRPRVVIPFGPISSFNIGSDVRRRCGSIGARRDQRRLSACTPNLLLLLLQFAEGENRRGLLLPRSDPMRYLRFQQPYSIRSDIGHARWVKTGHKSGARSVS